ncbi:hypothetical protein Aab01nite_49240 [Paractinoplanes abujensis]|nr:hypothetical protein Aab01nite_49240 [Actinoplanes abujensis]
MSGWRRSPRSPPATPITGGPSDNPPLPFATPGDPTAASQPAAAQPIPIAPARTSPRDRQPGMSEIRALVSRIRAAGQPVELVEEGGTPPLSEGRQITAVTARIPVAAR